MQALEDLDRAVQKKSLLVTADALEFDSAPLGQDPEKPPEHWVTALGLEGAQRKMRRVAAGQANSRDAPTGLKMAAAVTTSAMKSRATKEHAPTLAIALVHFPEAARSAPYPVKVIDASASED